MQNDKLNPRANVINFVYKTISNNYGKKFVHYVKISVNNVDKIGP